MGLTMLPIARESPWLNAAGVAYPDGIPFHRVTGWWCCWQVLIHSLAETAAVMFEGFAGDENTHAGYHNDTKWGKAWSAIPVFVFPWVERLDDDTGAPELNSEAVVNFLGLLGTVAAVIMMIWALPIIRRRFYHLFYNVHVPAGLFFVMMATLHNFPMQMFIVPGLVAYFLDRTDLLGRTAANRHRKGHALITLLTDEWVRLDVQLGDVEHHGPATVPHHGGANGLLESEGAPGTHWMYIRVPAVGGEWHPFSLCDRTASVIVKAAGDWTKMLHRKCVEFEAKGLKVPVHVDGVYGNQCPPWQPYRRILLIGGGVGVTPWLPMMNESLRRSTTTTGGHVPHCSLVWVARNENEYVAMRKWLPAARTRVFLTRAKGKGGRLGAGADRRPSGAKPAKPLAARVQVRDGKPLQVAVVATLALLVAYLAYYLIVQVPDNAEEDDDDGGDDGHTNNTMFGSSHNSTDAPWVPTTLWSYFWVKRAAPVACTAIAVPVITLACRALARTRARGLLKCPWTGGSPGPLAVESARGAHESISVHEVLAFDGSPPPVSVSAGGEAAHEIQSGRPDITALVAEAAARAVEDAAEQGGPGGASGKQDKGLFVCVCGPGGMIKMAKEAVAAVRKQHAGHMHIGFHAEAPEW